MEYQNYIYLNGEKIPVSAELWEEYRKEKQRVHKLALRHNRCSCLRWEYCEMDCELCRYRLDGDKDSIDRIREECGDSADEFLDMPASMFTERIMDSIIIGDLRDRLCTLDEEERTICELIMADVSERDAAERMGLSKTTFHDRKARLFAKLREKWSDLKDFF